MSDNDARLVDLARRLLDGEAIDWEKEGFVEADVREGMQRLAKIVGRVRGGETDTAGGAPPEPPRPPPPLPPPRSREHRFIGDFRLVRKLGEGGMGVVYEAEQQHPRRPVALKVIRGGAHVSEDTLKLFQRESSTLARLRHPGIAALYETGATEDGLHYFAMELVRGSTLSAWIGRRPAGPISPDELKLRLSVFKRICDAVAYAHQRGVIHRDLKPANVLIPTTTGSSSIQDPVPDVKVLDFGLARITDSDVQATTYVTEMGRVQGTLPYMSPEQVRGNPDEIDLRTDVYSLGVMLYEMVTGHLPHDLSKAQIPEAVRIICEEPPRSISATFSGTKRLDADVITIAGKCLEKEASRRYQSAAALGEDIQRYLSDQPILARPPSATYQFRKLVARHKAAFGFAATVFVLVTALAITSTVQAVRIAKERDRANQEAETAKRVSEFLEGLFKISDPSESRGKTITAREILDAGAEKIERELGNQPQTRARLLETMGGTYLSLGLFDRAEGLLQGSLRANEQFVGARSLPVARVEVQLGMKAWGEGDFRDSLTHGRRAEDILRDLSAPDDPIRLKAIWLVGMSLMGTGDLDGGRTRLREGLNVLDGSAAPNDRLRIWFLNDLGNAEVGVGNLDGARAFFERALEVRERVYPDERDTERINGLNNLAYVLLLQGDTVRARPMLERCARLGEDVYGRDHIFLANVLEGLAEACRRDGDFDAAREALVRSVSIFEKNGLRRAPAILGALVTRARLEEDEGQLSAAESSLREAIGIVTASLGHDSPFQIDATDLLARVMRKSGKASEAEALERRASELRARSGQTNTLALGASVPQARIE